MPKAFKIGDRIRFEGTAGEVTESLTPEGQVGVRLADGRVLWTDPEQLKRDEPEHKMVEGPREPR